MRKKKLALQNYKTKMEMNIAQNNVFKLLYTAEGAHYLHFD